MPQFGLSANRLARDLRVPVTRIAEILHERWAITPDTALRLARYFGTSAEFWMHLQMAFDLDSARSGLARIESDVRPVAAAWRSAPQLVTTPLEEDVGNTRCRPGGAQA